MVEQARSRGVPVVFSADDLVFSPEDCDAPALSDPREDVVRGFRWTLEAYARSLAASDAFLGSTEVLVEAAREHGVPGLLVRNGIGRAMLDRLDRARRARIAAEDALPAPPCGVRIGFLTGTDTHDRDLESIAAPLVRALGRVPDATLVVVGPARLPAALEAMGDRVERVPFVPWSAFAGILAGLDLCLAPLERPNRFNEAKSEVKLIEAALAGVATVASPTGPFRHASGDGRFARLAGGPDDWETAVVELATDPDLRRGLARAARRHVVFRYGPHVQADALVDGLVDIVARGARAGRPPLPEPVELDGDGERGACVAIEPSDLPWDAWQLAADEGAIVGPGREVEQEIPVRASGLRRIDVMVGTFWRRNRHALDLSLR
ncbi:MAG: glycosyltransferase, partial [Alphaproteobacteria bacterium]